MLYNNTLGGANTANGERTLFSNTTGSSNTAVGGEAMYSNTIGSVNTAHGVNALFSNTTGGFNTAIGEAALLNNEMGDKNTAVGGTALYNHQSGNNNMALGFAAGQNIVTGSFNIDIGNEGVFDESRVIRVGDSQQRATFIAGIHGVTTGNADAIPVLIDSAGQLGTVSSSRRFKKEIKPMDKASESILALEPVTFHYKSDNSATPQFGLIAEEVAEVNPELVVRDANGEIYTVRYEAVNAMLLNEFLKEHRKVEQQNRKLKEQEVMIAQLKKDVQVTATHQQKQIEALTAGLQKVSDQLEVGKPAPRVVNNP